MDREISESVRRFLSEHIGSYEELELPLALVRGPRALASANEDALARLRAHGLADVRNDQVLFAPANEELARAVETLAREDLLAVMKILNENAIARVRTAAIGAFADAFLLKKEKEKK